MQRMEEILRQRAYAPDISFIRLFMDSVDHVILFPTHPPLQKTVVFLEATALSPSPALSPVVIKSPPGFVL